MWYNSTTTKQNKGLKMKRIELTETELRSQYDEMLDDCYPIFKMGCLEFYPSDILKKMDNIAYECDLNDYYSNICNEYYCKDME